MRTVYSILSVHRFPLVRYEQAKQLIPSHFDYYYSHLLEDVSILQRSRTKESHLLLVTSKKIKDASFGRICPVFSLFFLSLQSRFPIVIYFQHSQILLCLAHAVAQSCIHHNHCKNNHTACSHSLQAIQIIEIRLQLALLPSLYCKYLVTS